MEINPLRSRRRLVLAAVSVLSLVVLEQFFERAVTGEEGADIGSAQTEESLASIFLQATQSDSLSGPPIVKPSLLRNETSPEGRNRFERLKSEKKAYLARLEAIPSQGEAVVLAEHPSNPASRAESQALPYAGGVEDFEGSFPGDFWFVGDEDSVNEVDSWGQVTCRNWEGIKSVWCAGVGDQTDCVLYDGFMQSYMFVEADYNGTSVSGTNRLYHRRWIQLEDGYDEFSYVIEGFIYEPPHGAGNPDATAIVGPLGDTAGWEGFYVELPPSFDACWFVRVTFWFDSDFVIVDEGAYLDNIEFNNLSDTAIYPISGGFTGSGPDLEIPTCTATVNPITCLLDVYFAVCNAGTFATGPIEVGVYASTDSIISTSDCQIGWGSTPALGVGDCTTFTGNLPADLCLPGTYYIGFFADTTFQVAEVDESDNSCLDGQWDLPPCAPDPDIRVEPTALTFDCSSGVSLPKGPQEPDPNMTPWWENRQRPHEKLVSSEEILRRLEESSRAEVIVGLVPPIEALNATNWNDPVSLGELHDVIAVLQGSVLEELTEEEFQLQHKFENIPAFSGDVSRSALEKLLVDPRVELIEPVFLVSPDLAQGIALINGTSYRPTHNGVGTAVAICDTGVDYTHAKLGGGGFPNGKVIGGYDTGDNDSDPIPQGRAHGTACAGIAAGNLGSTGDYIGGVAHNAKIYALKITSGSAGSTGDDEIIDAWDWCVSHKNDDPSNPIVAISTSFGGGGYASICDSTFPTFAAAASNARAAGIVVLASAGNDGYCDAVERPACLSDVLAVGAVYDASIGSHSWCIDPASCTGTFDGGCTSSWRCDDPSTFADQVICYSNSADHLALLAPSNDAHTTDISGSPGYSTGDYTPDFGGTSASCPYAAGAVAALQSASKAINGNFLSANELATLLIATGDPVTDGKVAITKPRVNLGNAIDSLGGGGADCFTIYNDGGATLTGSITPESGWITVDTTSFSITRGGIQEVCVSVDCGACSGSDLNGRIRINSNDPDENPVYVNVTATCGDPAGMYIPTDLEGAPGGLIDVPVYVDNVTDMVGYFFRVTFNTSVLSYQSSTNGTLTSGWPAPTVNVVGNELRVGNFSAVPTSGTGSIVVLRFLGVGASGQCSSMQFQEATINDIPASTTDGLVCLTQQFRWGDLGSAPPNEDCDDIVGMVDASLVMQVLVGIRDRFPCYTGDVGCVMPADLNGDGVCGAVDASLIAQWVVGLLNCFPADGNCDGFGPDPVPTPGSGAEASVSPQSLTLVPHQSQRETAELSVEVEGAEGLLGYCLDVTFDPERVQPAEPLWAKDETLTSHWLDPVFRVSENHIRIAAFGWEPLSQSKGSLLKLRFHVQNDTDLLDWSVIRIETSSTLNDLQVPMGSLH